MPINSAINLRDIGGPFFSDIGKLPRETDGLHSFETARRRPYWMARASSISRSAWRVSRSNSRGSLCRAALCRDAAAALRSSIASAASACGSRLAMAPDRVITASLLGRLGRPLIESPCGLDVRFLRTCAILGWIRRPISPVIYRSRLSTTKVVQSAHQRESSA